MTATATDGLSAPASTRRRVGVWVGIVLGLVSVGVVGAGLTAALEQTQRSTLDPESAGPDGARAVVEVLRDHGVDVTIARDLEAARGALGPSDTLVLPDAVSVSTEELQSLAAGAATTVLVEPRSRTLRALVGGSLIGGAADTPALSAECDAPVAARADAIDAGATYIPGDAAVGCYPSGSGDALVLLDDGERLVAAVDGRALLANDRLAAADNAALAIALLGQHDHLVWYVPALGDGASTEVPTLGDLTPDWVTPSIALLVVSAIAAAVWRGRRFGPLVAERLPVTVRGTETTDGRARLYARSGDAGHAADLLRGASLDRLARLAGLGPHASDRETADAVAALLGADRGGIHALLIDRVAESDDDLVEIADGLRRLETHVHAILRNEGTTP